MRDLIYRQLMGSVPGNKDDSPGILVEIDGASPITNTYPPPLSMAAYFLVRVVSCDFST